MTQSALYDFLQAVDGDYPVPLSKKVDLQEYAQKLFRLATLCPVIRGETVLALTAGYTQNVTENMGYIALVGTRKEARRQGFGKDTVLSFLEDARKAQLRGVHLYTAAENTAAIGMYRALGFVDYAPATEPRPEDIHLVYWF